MYTPHIWSGVWTCTFVVPGVCTLELWCNASYQGGYFCITMPTRPLSEGELRSQRFGLDHLLTKGKPGPHPAGGCGRSERLKKGKFIKVKTLNVYGQATKKADHGYGNGHSVDHSQGNASLSYHYS